MDNCGLDVRFFLTSTLLGPPVVSSLQRHASAGVSQIYLRRMVQPCTSLLRPRHSSTEASDSKVPTSLNASQANDGHWDDFRQNLPRIRWDFRWASPALQSSQDDELAELQALCRSQATRIVQLENLCTQQKALIKELESERAKTSRSSAVASQVVSRAGLLASPRTSLGRRHSDTVTAPVIMTPLASPRPPGPSEALQRAQDLADLWGQRSAPQMTGALPSPRPSPRGFEARIPASVASVAWRPTQEISRSMLLPTGAKHVETRLVAGPVPAYPVASSPGSLLVPGRIQADGASTNLTTTIFHTPRYGIPASPPPVSPRLVHGWPEAKVSLLWSPVAPRLERPPRLDGAPELGAKTGTAQCATPQPQERVRPIKSMTSKMTMKIL
eukprot:s183_g23.t1